MADIDMTTADEIARVQRECERKIMSLEEKYEVEIDLLKKRHKDSSGWVWTLFLVSVTALLMAWMVDWRMIPITFLAALVLFI